MPANCGGCASFCLPIRETATLQTNSTLSLDTGATASSGGDLLWNASGITPQGKARAINFGAAGPTLNNSYDETALKSLFDFLVAATNSGNVAKVLVPR